jgi:hypothetical protein
LIYSCAHAILPYTCVEPDLDMMNVILSLVFVFAFARSTELTAENFESSLEGKNAFIKFQVCINHILIPESVASSSFIHFSNFEGPLVRTLQIHESSMGPIIGRGMINFIESHRSLNRSESFDPNLSSLQARNPYS